MKSKLGVFARALVLALLCLGLWGGSASAAGGSNRCKDRCNQAYRLRKDICKAIPYKRQRHSCEDSAKRARDECKRRCR
jgi:hypothetical protein